LEKGLTLVVEGGFKTRYNSDQYEFKLGKIHLLETVKPVLTKQVVLEVEPQFINKNFINFVETNVKANPGKAS
jgi:DNA polymerase-3 subunit alpha